MGPSEIHGHLPRSPGPGPMYPLLIGADRRGRDRIVVGFTITCAISAYHNYNCEFESRSW